MPSGQGLRAFGYSREAEAPRRDRAGPRPPGRLPAGLLCDDVCRVRGRSSNVYAWRLSRDLPPCPVHRL